ncbi:thioredoxin-like protein 1 [Actinia tenebrosa]|uniref:Thioredoxin-like protein 1 n=1 Tax=Actinia tenebrosa TaxID=6105 RepID=A0A6P8ING2_ACTTE|nr:thioredoxin-like protein 1 [Actinia tenebrosa]
MAANSIVKTISEDSLFKPELVNAGTKLVVVDFTASWCGPCQRIAPEVEKLSRKYPNVVFLKVDVEVCQETAAKQGVSAMPTFQFFKSQTKVDEMTGADHMMLENKIKQWKGDDGEEGGGCGVKGHVDLHSFINKSGCESLNEDNEHTLADALSKGPAYLQSDCDEQLLFTIAFNQPVKIHSIKLQAPNDGKAPKTIKLFINQTKTLDFDSAEQFTPIQTLELTADDVKDDSIIQLKYVKFQNVQNMTFFVKDNQGDEELTVINYLCIIGSTVDTTNMQDFKRISGKKGESH